MRSFALRISQAAKRNFAPRIALLAKKSRMPLTIAWGMIAILEVRAALNLRRNLKENLKRDFGRNFKASTAKIPISKATKPGML